MRAACWAVVLGLLSACEQSRQDMYDQPKYKPLAASPLFADGSSARTSPEGTLAAAQGPFAGSSSGRLGSAAVQTERAAGAAQMMPYAVDAALLARGQGRYDIFCLPCHGATGGGDGRVVQRGFPAPLPFADARLRSVSDRHLYDVISSGYGIMYPFADKLDPSERWAVVAFVRALQTGRHAGVSSSPGRADEGRSAAGARP